MAPGTATDDSKVIDVNQLRLSGESLPSPDQMVLLYRVSYLGLAKSPRLMGVVKQCAISTQSYFQSSEAVLQKCVDTSNQMVSTMFPQLKLAVQNEINAESTKCLEIAREWIREIVVKVEEMVERSETLNRSVASCTSDVILEKAEREKQNAQTTKEIEALEQVVRDLQMDLRKTLEELQQIETKINQCQSKIASGRFFFFFFLGFIIPFVGHFLQPKPANNQALINEKNQLVAEKSSLKSKEQNIQVRMSDFQLKISNMKTEMGSMPETRNLNDAHKLLYKVQQSLLKHNMFWKTVLVFLEALNAETFANEHMTEDHELKEFVLKHYDKAQEHWKVFGETCLKAKKAVSLQNKDAFKFLELNPSSLSEEEWKSQCVIAVMDLVKAGIIIW